MRPLQCPDHGVANDLTDVGTACSISLASIFAALVHSHASLPSKHPLLILANKYRYGPKTTRDRWRYAVFALGIFRVA